MVPSAIDYLKEDSMLYATPTNIILASESPRRRDLLSSVLGTIQISRPSFEESLQVGEAPAKYVERNSFGKASSIAQLQGPGPWIVVGADTIVVKDGQVLEKPKSQSDAYQMLKSLSGGCHQVITGYCLLAPVGPAVIKHIVTQVYFLELSDTLIQRYIDTNEPMDKAGGYGIQGLAASFVEKIEGSYTNVVGLPLAQIVRDIEEIDSRFSRA